MFHSAAGAAWAERPRREDGMPAGAADGDLDRHVASRTAAFAHMP